MGSSLGAADRKLFLAIAHCPVIRGIRAGQMPNSPCTAIVNLQARRPPEAQIAEPWVGHLDAAPILFIASNPGWDEGDGGIAPEGEAEDEDKLIDRFVSYFDKDKKYSVDGIRGLNADGKPQLRWVRYWAFAKRRAMELLSPTVVPGLDYALTEVVHCNSKSEATGAVWEALKECGPRYLHPVLARSPAKLVVVVGKVAAAEFARQGYDPAQRLIGPTPLADRDRLIAFLPHPNSRGGPKTFAANLPDHLDRIRAFIAAG